MLLNVLYVLIIMRINFLLTYAVKFHFEVLWCSRARIRKHFNVDVDVTPLLAVTSLTYHLRHAVSTTRQIQIVLDLGVIQTHLGIVASIER